LEESFMNRAMRLIALAAALAACAPAGAPPEPAAPEPQPAQEFSAAFPDCTWGEVRAAGVSVWSFACPQQRLVGDETLPGFLREEAGQRHPVIWIFTKAAQDPIEAALPAIRAASPGGEACVLEPGAEQGRYQLMPEGEARRAYDAFTSGQGEGPSMPCGPLGPSEAGMRVVQIVAGAPDKVAVIDAGSDIQIFDANTLRATP
jgi:hypothetical protein